jgi:hypothetical protein
MTGASMVLPSFLNLFHKSGSAGASSSGVPVNQQASSSGVPVEQQSSSAAQPTGASRRAIAELVVRAVDLDK